jgi:hypothetical protein
VEAGTAADEEAAIVKRMGMDDLSIVVHLNLLLSWG